MVVDWGSNHPIDRPAPTKQNAQVPEAFFSVAYTPESLLLRFNVVEDNLVALETEVNAFVYQDSCVEFFFSPGRNNLYFNLEVNAIGATYMAYGTDDHDDRATLPPEQVERIQVYSSAGNKIIKERDERTAWTMTIVMPFGIIEPYGYDAPERGDTWTVNAYKTAKRNRKPHWFSWSPLAAGNGFHAPQCFGALVFE